MKMNKAHVSSMQVEVWRMKDKVYRDTKSMDSGAFFRYVAGKSRKALKHDLRAVRPPWKHLFKRIKIKGEPLSVSIIKARREGHA